MFRPHHMTGVSQRVSQPSGESARIQINNFQLFFQLFFLFLCVTLYTTTKPSGLLQQRRSFLSVSYSKTNKTITIPEERRRKQRNIHPYNNVIASWDWSTRSDVVPWILTSQTKPGFTAVDAFVTQYYMKLVCTAFVLWMFWCVLLTQI